MLGLMASGLEGQRFSFHGYLPARDPERAIKIVALDKESARVSQTQLFIETPYRNQALFKALLEHCQPKTRLCLASDLTAPTESVMTHRISEWRGMPTPQLDKRPTVFLMLADSRN
jgi:16S rRNA (cytidine1402-2'-O)-methyltransferase